MAEKSIRKKAYMGDKGLKKAVIPPGTEIIEDWAFANCTALKEILLPTSVRVISDKAFLNCDLRSVSICSSSSGEPKRLEGAPDPSLLALTFSVWPKEMGVLLAAAKQGNVFYQLLDQRIPAFLEEADNAGFLPFLAGGEEDYGVEEAEKEHCRIRRYRKAKLLYERFLAETDGYSCPEGLRKRALDWLQENNPNAAFGVILQEMQHREEYLNLYFTYELDKDLPIELLSDMAGEDTELKAQIMRRRLEQKKEHSDTVFDQFRI